MVKRKEILSEDDSESESELDFSDESDSSSDEEEEKQAISKPKSQSIAQTTAEAVSGLSEDSDFEADAKSKAKSTPPKSLQASPKSSGKGKLKSPIQAKKAKKITDDVVKPAPKSISTSAATSFVPKSKGVSTVPTSVTLPDITRGDIITTGNAARKLIHKYMLLQNRPYSAIQVTDNLHKRIAKDATARVLGELVDEGVLRRKDYGKASIFFPDQSHVETKLGAEFPDYRPTAEGLRQATKHSAERHSECTALESKGAHYDDTLAELLQAHPDDDLDAAIAEKEQVVETKRQRVAALGQSVAVDPNTRTNVVKEHNFYLKSWRSLRRKVMNFAGDVADSMNKKTKDVMEMFGVETDESEGITSLPEELSEKCEPKRTGLTYR